MEDWRSELAVPVYPMNNQPIDIIRPVPIRASQDAGTWRFFPDRRICLYAGQRDDTVHRQRHLQIKSQFHNTRVAF